MDPSSALSGAFAIPGTLTRLQPYGAGHINETLLATYRGGNGDTRYIHQRINRHVFHDIPALMNNVARITRHLGNRSIRLIEARDGSPYYVDASGEYWRAYEFVEDTLTVEVPDSPAQAFAAARAFGDFALRLADLPGPPLHAVIPHFHDTPQRLEALLGAVHEDPAGRCAAARDEISAGHEYAGLARLWESLRAARVPERVAHNDTKISNVLLSRDSAGVNRVVDLDTVMPGMVLCDVGELVRTAAASAREDERDPSKMHVRPEYYRAIVRGFLEGSGALLSAIEREHLVPAAKIMTYENAIRFLTDYLQGDVYFRISRPAQNLDRARAQFALLRSLEARERELVVQ